MLSTHLHEQQRIATAIGKDSFLLLMLYDQSGKTPAIFPQEAKKPKKQSAKRTKKPSRPNEWNCGYFRPAWDVGTFDRLDFWSLLWSDVLDGEMPWIELQYSVCSFY